MEPVIAGATVVAGAVVIPNAIAAAGGLLSATGGTEQDSPSLYAKPAPPDGAGAVVGLLGFVSLSFDGAAAGADPPKDPVGALVAEVFESVPNENDGALSFDLSPPKGNVEDAVAAPALLLVALFAWAFSEPTGFAGVEVVGPNENDDAGFAGVSFTAAWEAGPSTVFFGAGVEFPKAKAAEVVPFLGGVVTGGVGDFDGVNNDAVEVEWSLEPPENFPFLALPNPISVFPSSFIARQTHSAA